MQKEKIITDLLSLGITSSDNLLVHSSLSSLGWVEGGAITVIQALIETLPEGNLLMPALTYEYINKENPKFYTKTTPVCVGIIPETFRNYPGVIRSSHPTHSICVYGKQAAEIAGSHHMDNTPVGENSPLNKLPKLGGKILMLGCGLRPNTSMHGVEEAAKAPYVLQSTTTKLYVDSRETFHYKHNLSNSGVIQRYDRVANICDMKKGKVLDADVYVIDANTLWETTLAKINEYPYYFVDISQ